MALDYAMVTTYGTFAKDDRQLAAWGNDVNTNLDDKISKTNTAIQAIASQINQNGLLNMGANIDLNAKDLIVDSGGDKTITAADLAFLVGLNQFLTTGSAAEFLTLKIGTLAGVLKASGGNVSGGADTDDLPVGATNKYYTTALHNTDFDLRLITKSTDDLSQGTGNLYYVEEVLQDHLGNEFIKNGTEVQWSYDDGANTLTPIMSNNTIATTRLANGANAQFLVASGTGVWYPRTMSGDGSISNVGVLTVTNLSLKANWDTDNSPVTRTMSVSPLVLTAYKDTDGTQRWVWDNPNGYVENNTNGFYTYIPLPNGLPNGAVITAFRVTFAGNATFTTDLRRRRQNSTAMEICATTTHTSSSIVEQADTSISNNPVDNDDWAYELRTLIGGGGSTSKMYGIQIDYTVVRPQP